MRAMEAAQTRYVDVGDAQVAYWVAGEGPGDLLVCQALGAQVDGALQVPATAELFRRLVAVRRIIMFDRRGSGASDRLPLNAIPTWEEMAEDVTAVLDAVASERAAVMAPVEAGSIAILFSALHPERVSHLILQNTSARYMEADDYPIGLSSQTLDAMLGLFAASWGTEEFTQMVVPSFVDDPEAMAAMTRMIRASASPRSAAAQYEYFWRSLDVRPFLPLVHAATLVLCAADSLFLPIQHGRYLVENIPDATLIEWPGPDVLCPLSEVPRISSDIIEFLTGDRPVEVDRVLATILFTDIVGSTERATSLGDYRWHALLDAHDRLVREQLRRFKGTEIKTTGDGFLASFDGPARAVRCAQAITSAVSGLGIEIRAGLHTGECEVRGNDLGGLAVHIAARIGAMARSREVVVSSTVKDLVVGSDLRFEDRGEHELKGVPGTWRLHTATS